MRIKKITSGQFEYTGIVLHCKNIFILYVFYSHVKSPLVRLWQRGTKGDYLGAAVLRYVFNTINIGTIHNIKLLIVQKNL